MAWDPIEKKPLYHWRPGSSILSAGFAGCNLSCPFCQNWHISQIGRTIPQGAFIDPKELVTKAVNKTGQTSLTSLESCQIAYTYSEPLVHAEYLIISMTEAEEKGVANILITNGCIDSKTAQAVLNHTNAVNVDLKSFSEKTYRDILKGKLPQVLDFINMAVSMGIHTEITTLIVPGLNDSEAELDQITGFIAEQSRDTIIPWHVSAYRPCWKWDAPATEPAVLSAITQRARKILPYVYTGNIADKNDTACIQCGALIVKRHGFRSDRSGLYLEQRKEVSDLEKRPDDPVFYNCAACNAATAIRWK